MPQSLSKPFVDTLPTSVTLVNLKEVAEEFKTPPPLPPVLLLIVVLISEVEVLK